MLSNDPIFQLVELPDRISHVKVSLTLQAKTIRFIMQNKIILDLAKCVEEMVGSGRINEKERGPLYYFQFLLRHRKHPPVRRNVKCC